MGQAKIVRRDKKQNRWHHITCAISSTKMITLDSLRECNEEAMNKNSSDLCFDGGLENDRYKQFFARYNRIFRYY